MPPYDLALILRNAARPELKEVIKRAIFSVRDHGGVIGPLEKLGEQRLPYRMKKNGMRHTHGFYMFMELDLPAHETSNLITALLRDKDIIRPTLIRHEVEMMRPCEKGECFFGELNNTELKLARRAGRFEKLKV